MSIIVKKPPGGGGGAGGGVESVSEDGSAQLTGDVTFSAGAGIDLTQVGNDIEIALSGGGGGSVLTGDSRSALALSPFSPWSIGPAIGAPAALAWQSANRAIFVPIYIPSEVTVSKLACGTGTGTTGNFDLGIYDEAGVRLVSTGSTAKTSASTKRVVDVADTVLAPGLYYLAMATDGTTEYQQMQHPTHAPATRLLGLRQMAAAFPLPANAVLATSGGNNVPSVGAYLLAGAALALPSGVTWLPRNCISPFHQEGGADPLRAAGGLWTGLTSATYGTANFICYWPFTVQANVTALKLSYVVGATSNGNIEMGIYDAAFARLVTSGTIAQAAANSTQEVDIADTALTPGLYYMALQFSSTTATLLRLSLADELLSPLMPVFIEAAGSFGLPATATPVETSSTAPFIPAMAVHFDALV